VKKWFARKILRLTGWKIEGVRPPHTHYVLIAAPHTSNWDFPLMLLFAAAFNIKITWMAKHGLFYPPMGWIMRAMGGMPVVRNKNTNVVNSMIDAFDCKSELVLTVPAEGTRARMDFWKSGFYHIARGAGVPIVPSYLDYGQKRGGFGPALITSDDLSADMDYLRSFYQPMAGKFPERFGPVRLREESGD
jgi:1-acyl-sn-glycerol-3-phosphate acyltransferase